MKRLLPGFLSGVMLWLSLPPFSLGFLAWVAFVPILYTIQSSSKDNEEVFTSSFLAAIIPIGGIAYGLIPFSVPFYLFLILFLPTLFGLLGVLYKTILKTFPNSTLIRILIVPSAWSLAEFILTDSLLSLPLNLALSQASYSLVIQIAGVGGVYLVGFVILLVNVLCCEIIRQWIAGYRKTSFRIGVSTVILIILVFTYGAFQMFNPISPHKTLSIAAIQPVVASEDYRDHWIDPDVRKRLSNNFNQLTERALTENRKLDFLIWPEGGNGYYNMRLPDMRSRFQEWAKKYHTNILLSSLDLDDKGKKFNSVFSIDSQGNLLDKYDKVQLTPIGEESFTAGKLLRLLQTHIGSVGVLVCFESSFPFMARDLKRQGAQMLLITSSDAPFRNSVFPLLHASMAVFRAVENRIAVIRSANTGPSMTIDPWGRILDKTSFYEETVLASKLPIYMDDTFYTKFGNGWMILPALFFFWTILGVIRHMKFKKIWITVGFKSRSVLSTVSLALIILFLVPSISLAVISSSSDSLGFKKGFSLFFANRKLQFSQDRLDEFAQRGLVDCGPAALAYVLNFFGVEHDQVTIRSRIEMTEKGTSMAELARYVKKVGFNAWGEQQNVRRLQDVTKPLIAFIANNHFVVILKTEGDWITFYDPAKPKKIYQLEARYFTRIWRGEVLRILPMALNYSKDI